MTYRPTVILDIDGVLAEFTYGFTLLAQKLGLVEAPWTSREQPTWKFSFHVDPVWEHVDALPDFWETLSPLVNEDDIDALHALHADANILYVTGRSGPANVAEQTKNWLQEFDLPQGPVLIVPRGVQKNALIGPMEHGVVGMLEDKPEILASLSAMGIPITARDWEYNRDVNVPRVQSVREFVKDLGVEARPGEYRRNAWVETYGYRLDGDGVMDAEVMSR